MEILVNRCFGGYGLSDEVLELYKSKKGITDDIYCWDIERDDPVLIESVKEVGIEKSANWMAELEIVNVPDDIEWTIEEYDGKEWIAEKHRTW